MAEQGIFRRGNGGGRGSGGKKKEREEKFGEDDMRESTCNERVDKSVIVSVVENRAREICIAKIDCNIVSPIVATCISNKNINININLISFVSLGPPNICRLSPPSYCTCRVPCWRFI